MPNVLSPRDLVFRPDNMDETVPHTGQIGRLSLPNRDNDSTKKGILEFWLGDLKLLGDV